MATFPEILDMVQQLGLVPENPDPDEQLFILNAPERGINRLIVDVEDPILVLEQVIMPLTINVDADALLIANRELVHGAYAIAQDNKYYVVWRDTLQLTNLDINELQGSINALELAMAEHANLLLSMTS